MGSSGTGPIIPAEFLIESELDVSFGTVYQGEPETEGDLKTFKGSFKYIPFNFSIEEMET